MADMCYLSIQITIALKVVKVSEMVQRKLLTYRSIIGLRAFRKIKYFGDIPRQLLSLVENPGRILIRSWQDPTTGSCRILKQDLVKDPKGS